MTNYLRNTMQASFRGFTTPRLACNIFSVGSLVEMDLDERFRG